MRTVRSFACERREVRRFERLLNETLTIGRANAIAIGIENGVNESGLIGVLVAVLAYGGHLVISGKMTSDALTAFLLYQMKIGDYFYDLGWVVAQLMKSVGASRKVFEYMRRVPRIINDGKMKPPVRGEILFNNVSFTYLSRPDSKILKGISLRIAPGETVAFVGPSGGGKSSLIALLERFYTPDSGEILLDGVSIHEYDHEYYHQKVALVAQEPVLYEGSVATNIAYGFDVAGEPEILEAARTANVADFVSRLDRGYATTCGERGTQMSGGQKQRIAIARALVRNPAVLVLDEATSALDSESEGLVQEAISRCAHERTVLVIAHRLSTIERADRIVVIDKGEIVQIGPHSELISDKAGLYYSLVNRQVTPSI